MTQAESDQPALGPDGQLLDASKIAWYNDPDDSRLIQPTTSTSGEQEGKVFKLVPILQRLIYFSGQLCQRFHPTRTTAGTRLADAIAAEKLDEYGSSCRCIIQPRDARASAKRRRPAADESRGGEATQGDTDTEDKTFAISVSEGSSGSDSDGLEVGNDEVCIIRSRFWYKLI